VLTQVGLFGAIFFAVVLVGGYLYIRWREARNARRDLE
jgi:hypothetical protein